MTKPKKPTGRPTKYKPEYCKQLIDFFDIEPYEEREIPHYAKDGSVKWVDFKRLPNRMPTKYRFAKSIGVGYSTIDGWLEKHDDFRAAYARARELRKWFLIENGLNRGFDSHFAKFTGINEANMKDTSEVKVDSEVGITIGVVQYKQTDCPVALPAPVVQQLSHHVILDED